MIQPATLQFLKALKKNNNKPWFDAHRSQYETAKKDFENFVQQVIDQHSKTDTSLKGLIAKNCIFRINRDVRFSKNKNPYKTNFGASINSEGKKSLLAGYYVHLEPGDIFIGGGVYMPMPEELKKIRQEIDYCFDEFKKLLAAPAFKKTYKALSTDKEYMLTRLPKGYEPGNPAEAFLKMKSYIAGIQVSDDVITSPKAIKTTVDAFKALTPLLAFFNRAMHS